MKDVMSGIPQWLEMLDTDTKNYTTGPKTAGRCVPPTATKLIRATAHKPKTSRRPERTPTILLPVGGGYGVDTASANWAFS